MNKTLADLMREAQSIVESKFLWKRFIDGTPLSNDISLWMAEFAGCHIEQLQAELSEARDRVYELEHAIFHTLDDSCDDTHDTEDPRDVTITRLDFENLCALLPEDWEHRSESNQSAPADDCAHSEANKHGCPECGEEFKSADKGQGDPVAWVQGFPRTDHFPAKLQEDRKNGYTIALYAEQPAPVAVVMPDRMVDFPKYDKLIAQGYNRCLDDVIRLNGVKP